MVKIELLRNKLASFSQPTKGTRTLLLLALGKYLDQLDSNEFENLIPNTMQLNGSKLEKIAELIESSEFYTMGYLACGPLRNNVWILYIGKDKISCICPMCDLREIHLMDMDWQMCHIIPKSKGGSMDLANLRPLCTVCNSNMKDVNMKLYCKNAHPLSYNRLKFDQPYIPDQLKLLVRELNKVPPDGYYVVNDKVDLLQTKPILAINNCNCGTNIVSNVRSNDTSDPIATSANNDKSDPILKLDNIPKTSTIIPHVYPNYIPTDSHTCPLCNITFSQKSTLVDHLNRKTKCVYLTPENSRILKLCAKNLNISLGNSYKCKFCKKVYTRNSYLTVHMKKCKQNS